MPAGADAPLRHMERRALWIFAISVVAAALSGGAPAVLGVIGGALIVAVSYRSIHAGVGALTAAMPGEPGASPRATSVWRLVKFITRFAILALIAYVMMVRLGAQPVWMLLGASSLVAAAALETVRPTRPRP